MSVYDSAVLADTPVAYWKLTGGVASTPDAGTSGNAAVYTGSPSSATMPNGDSAVALNGSSQYAQVADHDAYSVATTGVLTIELWLRLAVENFPSAIDGGDGPYVGALKKGSTSGVSGDQEWAIRMYSLATTRPHRISGYVFNPTGGLGAGSYVEEPTGVGQWVHIAAVFDNVTKGGDGWGTIKLYKNGVLKDSDSMGAPYNITPVNTASVVQIGAVLGESYFAGSIGKVALYNYVVPQSRLAAHYAAMGSVLDSVFWLNSPGPRRLVKAT